MLDSDLDRIIHLESIHLESILEGIIHLEDVQLEVLPLEGFQSEGIIPLESFPSEDFQSASLASLATIQLTIDRLQSVGK